MTEYSDPKRWSDATSGAPPRVAALLRDAERDVPHAAELEALARRLAPEFAAPAFESGRRGSGIGKAPRIGRVLGVLVLAGVVGVVAVRAFAPTRVEPHSPAPAGSTSVLAPAVAPSGVLEPSEPPSAPSLPAPEAPSPATPASPASPARTAGSVIGEAELLEQARRALAGNPGRALSLTRQHQERFPKGVLRQEREVIAIEALRRLGRVEDAERRGGTFEKQYPGSAHRRAVETGLGK